MTKNNVHFMSRRDDWETPKELFESLNREFHFTLDPCCSKKTAKCPKFYTKKDDGLSKDWSEEVVFMNPPYGREISHWVKKAHDESAKFKGAKVVALIPARTDTSWWHDFVIHHKIKFIRGRIKFGGGNGSAPFPSAIVIYDSNLS